MEHSMIRLISRRTACQEVIDTILQQLTTILGGDEDDTVKHRSMFLQLGLLRTKMEMLDQLDRNVQDLTDDDQLRHEIVRTDQNMLALIERRERFVLLADNLRPPSPPRPHEEDRYSTRSEAVASAVADHLRSTKRSSRLPKLDLPEFSGNVMEFAPFWDSFSSEIDSDTSLSNVSKFNYLKAKLKLDAWIVIEGLRVTEENYPKALGLLKDRFGDPMKAITAHFNALHALPQMNESLQSMRSFYDTLESHVRSLEAMDRSTTTYGALLVCSLMGKIHPNVRRDLARSHGRGEWTLDELRTALLNEIEILETSQVIPRQGTASNNASSSTTQFTVLSNVPGGKPISCPFCSESHWPTECQKYRSSKDRFQIAQQKNLCFNCLFSHRRDECRSKKKCRKCDKRHHTSLHKDDREPRKHGSAPSSSSATTTAPTASTATPVSSSATVSVVNNETSTLSITGPGAALLKTAVAPIESKGLSRYANILLDEGSHRSFVTIQFQQAMELPVIRHDSVNLSTFGFKQTRLQTLQVAELSIMADDGGRIPIQALVVPHITNAIKNQLKGDAGRTFSHLYGLKLAHPFNSSDDFRVDVLIGADFYWQIVMDRVIRNDFGPVAVESRLGYLLSGPTGSASSEDTSTLFINVDEEFDLSKFWKTESLGILPEREDEWLQEYKRSSISFENGQYRVKLPWKEEHPPLESNLALCQARTRATVRRIHATPGVLDTYSSILKDQLNRGIIEQIAEDPPRVQSVHYINHHPVFKPDSLTTPVRIVYDCSQNTKSGASLNDCLEEGPPLQNNMLHLYLRFRLNPIGIIADIEKAFHMILLDERERDYFRFLFPAEEKNPEARFAIYRFKCLPFGANCSPFILGAVIQKHLEQFNSSVVSDIQQNIYVDNLTTGCNDAASAIAYHDEANKIMSQAGLHLRVWDTNDPTAFKAFRPGERFDDKPSLKVLGLIWNRVNDTLGFPSLSLAHFRTSSATKRDVSKAIASVFDPLGLLSPVTIRGKILLQELWTGGYEWDQPLPPPTIEKWTSLAFDLEEVVKFTIQRRYFTTSSTIKTVHVFVDSSTKAFGAAAYFNDGFESSLAVAKTRVAPLTKRSLPELELEAALIGTVLAESIQTAFADQGMTVSIKMWSDSQDVLYWLVSKKKLKLFVFNRVKLINLFNKRHNASWGYCPTKENPADLLTRGIQPEDLFDSKPWIAGPSWLNDPESWPKWSPSKEVSTNAVHFEQVEPALPGEGTDISKVMSIERFSKMRRLVRSTAWVLRFVSNCRRGENRRHAPDEQVKRTLIEQLPPLSTREELKAKRMWIRSVQFTSFPEEITYLQSNRLGKRSNLVGQLDLFISDRIIRCGGRLGNAAIKESAKQPILLPKGKYFTALIINDIHSRICHGGVSSTVAALRESFWVPSGRQQVKKILHHCVKCKAITGHPYPSADPAPLPKERVWNEPPFTGTGIDLTGAFYVKSKSNPDGKKVYIALFTCTSSRAIHLEVVEDLSAETFMDALRRFANRRSTPRIIFSDNATNFESSASIIKTLLESPSVSQFLSGRAIEWRFIVKRAPWHGGFWERLIGLTKSTLKKVLGRTKLTARTLRTVITDVEASLNDRPLTYSSSDFSDREPITPSHLIFGQRIIPFPIEDPPEDQDDAIFGEEPTEFRRRVQERVKLLSHIRKRWKHEYLTALREHHSTTKGKNNEMIQKGDVVHVHDDVPRLLWKLAVVDSLIRGPDGKVRSAYIRTTTGKTSRPIEKLYPLEVREEPQPAPAEPTPTAPLRRSTRKAAEAARERVAGWIADEADEE